MSADPEPKNAVVGIDRERSVMRSDPHGVKATHALEVERGMSGIGLKEVELLVGERADGFWQSVIALPETRCGIVIQSFRERPA